jgi:hypothetical protein
VDFLDADLEVNPQLLRKLGKVLRMADHDLIAQF